MSTSPPLYILCRTSGRPRFFGVLYDSVRALLWDGPIVLVVHTDDPRDTYVRGDIIVRGECYIKDHRTRGPYNLYNNRLLDVLRELEPGWVHFIDDDDYYKWPDCFVQMAEQGLDRTRTNLGRVVRIFDGGKKKGPARRRGGGKPRTIIYPKNWKHQNSYQTECFVLWSTVATKGKWPASTGGDHTYSRGITAFARPKWFEGIYLAAAQERKGRGGRLDRGGARAVYTDLEGDVPFKYNDGTIAQLPAAVTTELDIAKKGRPTYIDITVERSTT